MQQSIGQRLEQYTAQRPQEVLIVKVEVMGEFDEILIFKGYSGSLMRPTVPDPDVPILSAAAKIISIDRLRSPYNPQAPEYLQRDLTWETIQPLLNSPPT
jgi:hypothetical protein